MKRPTWIAIVLALLTTITIGTRNASAVDPAWFVSSLSSPSQSTQVGTAFGDQFSIMLICFNIDSCPDRNNVNVTFTISTSGAGASATFSNGTNTAVVATSGAIATSPPFTANSIAGDYIIEARPADPNPEVGLLNIQALHNTINPGGAASISTGDGSNQATLISTAFPIRFNAIIFDGSNNLLPGITVTFTAPPSTEASGTFTGTGTNVATVVTNATGVATAPVFTANGTFGIYFVTATVDGSQTTTGDPLQTPFAVRNSVSNVIGVPDIVSASAGNIQGVGVLTTLPIDLQVVVLDGQLNYVPGATVTFSAPNSGATGTFANGTTSTTAVSGGTGLATATTFTTNDIVGQIQITVTATKDGVTASTNMGVINGMVDTTTTLTFNPNGGSVYGQPVVISATVLPVRGTYVPTGSVTFKRNNVSIPGCTGVPPSFGVATCTLSSLANTDESTWLQTGSHNFTADYAGDVVSNPSSAPQVSYTVSKANTSVVLTTSQPTFVLHGESVTFTATITASAPGRGVVIQQVTFSSSDATALNSGSPVALVDGVGQVSTTALTPGTHTISANYPGHTNFNGSSDTLSQNVYTIPEVTLDPLNALVLIPNQATFTADATGVPNPAVQWQISTDGGSTFTDISGATSKTYSFTPIVGDDQSQYQAVFTNPAGTDTSAAAVLTVRQSPSFTSGSSTTFTVGTEGSFAVTVDGYLPPTIALTSGDLPDGVTFGDVDALGVQALPETGASETLSGTPTDGTGGVYVLEFTATNGTVPTATQIFTLHVIEPPMITSADTTTFVAGTLSTFTITADGHPASTFTTPSTLPAGVTLAGDGTLSGTPNVFGTFVLEITATNGNAPDATQTFTLVVEQADQNPLILSVTPDNGVTGDKLAISLTGGSGAGAVTYDIGSSTACSLGTGADDGKLLINDGVGDCSLTATKAASGYFKSATSNTVTVTVNKTVTSLVISPLTGVFGGSVNLIATLTSNGTPLGGEIVTFSLDGNEVDSATTDGSGIASLLNVSLSGLDAGLYANGFTANYAGDSVYASASESADLTIDKAAGSATISNIPSPAYIGSNFTPSVLAAGDGVTSVASLSIAICSVGAGQVNFLATGTCDLQASVAEGTNHLAATGAVQSFQVTPPPVLLLSALSSGFNGWITATLTAFAPSTAVTLTWDDGSTLGTATTNGSGAASISFRTPLDVFGPHVVTASDGIVSDTAILSITTRIKLTTTSGPVGTVTRVYLYGYAAGDQVAIRFFSATGRSAKILKTLTIADNGRATSLITVPNTTVPGQRMVAGTVFGTGRNTITFFTITAVPHVAVSTSSPTATQSPTATETPTPVATDTVVPTETALPTETSAPTETPLPTETPVPTETAQPTETPDATEPPIPTDTPTPLPNASPVAAGGDDQTVIDGDGDGQELVMLDGSGSTDPEAGVLSYQWSEGDTVLSTEVSPQLYLGVGTHSLVLTVTDDGGIGATDEVVVIVEVPPTS